jgi:hypothetical protein
MKCSVQDCTRPAYCKGLCRLHYQHLWRSDPDNHNRTLELNRQSAARKQARKSAHLLTVIRNKHAQRHHAALTRQVAHHLAKGRSLADILVWTDQPASVISPIVASLQSPLR